MSYSSLTSGMIVLVNLGDISEIKGHEQAKLRPCVVVACFPHLQLATVLPVTSNEKLKYYTIVPLVSGAGGLVKDSYVLCHQIRTISFERITKAIGKLESRDYMKVQVVLADMLKI